MNQYENGNQNKEKQNHKNKIKNIKKIKILYTNADQLTQHKKLQLIEMIMQHKPLLVAVCEMKPKHGSERTIQDYNIPGYSIYPVNLDKDIGRGLAIYAHSSIAHAISEVNVQQEFREYCAIEFRLCNKDNLLFGCFYRSPTTSNIDYQENNNNLNNLLKVLCNGKKYSHICIVGDFNFKNINWENWSTNKSEESIERKFLESLRDCFLYQSVTEPTRSRGTDESSLIDLVLTNEEMQFCDVEYHAPLGNSDHSILIFDYTCYTDDGFSSTKYLYGKADYEIIKKHLLDQDWKNNFILNHTALIKIGKITLF